jgi:NAD(P)-dependent dehydrogenase (short-subunit alcohol dehydrogenase family)
MEIPFPDLTNRSALVTGGGRGIGRAAALALSRCGARVIVTARSADQIDAVAREIKESGGDALAIPADIAHDRDVRRLFDRAGPIDILVNNAGIIEPIAPLVDTDPTAWLRNIRVNLDGVYLGCRHVLPGMLERGWGRIVTVSSGAARGTTAGWSAYSAAKAAVEALTGVLAREVAGRDVVVLAVRPGIVDTEMQVEIRASTAERFGSDNLERFRGYHAHGLLRPPEEPARLILWALTEDAAAYHGGVVSIDDPEIAPKIGLTPSGR